MKILVLNKKEEDILRKSLLNYYEFGKYSVNKNDINLIKKFNLKIINLLERKGEKRICL